MRSWLYVYKPPCVHTLDSLVTVCDFEFCYKWHPILAHLGDLLSLHFLPV